MTGGLIVSTLGLVVTGGITSQDKGLVVSLGGMTVTGNVYVTGSITATTVYASASLGCCGSSYSDRRLKTHIIPLQNALNKINSIRGVYFHWNRTVDSVAAYSRERQVGVIAQEIQSVLPEIVQNVTQEYLGVDYALLAPLLIEGIKELANQTSALQCTVDAMQVPALPGDDVEGSGDGMSLRGANISSPQMVTRNKASIQQMVQVLQTRVVSLESDNQLLHTEVKSLHQDNDSLKADNQLLHKDNDSLRTAVTDLERKLGVLMEHLHLQL